MMNILGCRHRDDPRSHLTCLDFSWAHASPFFLTHEAGRPEIGNWQIANATELHTSQGYFPRWTVAVDMEMMENEVFEYKYFLRPPNGHDKDIQWEHIPNRLHFGLFAPFCRDGEFNHPNECPPGSYASLLQIRITDCDTDAIHFFGVARPVLKKLIVETISMETYGKADMRLKLQFSGFLLGCSWLENSCPCNCCLLSPARDWPS